MEKSYSVGSWFDEEVGTPVGFRPKQMKVSIEIPQKDKIIFKGWDMSLRDGVYRKIPIGTVFKVVHVTRDGKFIRGTNPDHTLSDIVFHSNEVEYTRVLVEVNWVNF